MIRDRLSDRNGLLHMVDFAKNEPMTQVNSWADLQATDNEQKLYHRSFTLVSSSIFAWISGITSSYGSILTSEANSEPTSPRGFCLVDIADGGDILPGSTYELPRIYIVLNADATITNLRSELDRVTGKSLSPYLIASGHTILRDYEKVFHSARVFTDSYTKSKAYFRRFSMFRDKTVTFKITDGNNEAFYEAKTTVRAGKVFQAFCERQSKILGSVRFMFDGLEVHHGPESACTGSSPLLTKSGDLLGELGIEDVGSSALCYMLPPTHIRCREIPSRRSKHTLGVVILMVSPC